ncbi:hypothetical protein [Paenimyroides ceti]
MKKVFFLAMFLIGTLSMSAQENNKPDNSRPPQAGSPDDPRLLPPVRLGTPEQEKQKEEERRRKAEEEYQKAKQLIAK